MHTKISETLRDTIKKLAEHICIDQIDECDLPERIVMIEGETTLYGSSQNKTHYYLDKGWQLSEIMYFQKSDIGIGSLHIEYELIGLPTKYRPIRNNNKDVCLEVTT